MNTNSVLITSYEITGQLSYEITGQLSVRPGFTCPVPGLGELLFEVTLRKHKFTGAEIVAFDLYSIRVGTDGPKASISGVALEYFDYLVLLEFLCDHLRSTNLKEEFGFHENCGFSTPERFVMLVNGGRIELAETPAKRFSELKFGITT